MEHVSTNLLKSGSIRIYIWESLFTSLYSEMSFWFSMARVCRGLQLKWSFLPKKSSARKEQSGCLGEGEFESQNPNFWAGCYHSDMSIRKFCGSHVPFLLACSCYILQPKGLEKGLSWLKFTWKADGFHSSTVTHQFSNLRELWNNNFNPMIYLTSPLVFSCVCSSSDPINLIHFVDFGSVPPPPPTTERPRRHELRPGRRCSNYRGGCENNVFCLTLGQQAIQAYSLVFLPDSLIFLCVCVCIFAGDLKRSQLKVEKIQIRHSKP